MSKAGYGLSMSGAGGGGGTSNTTTVSFETTAAQNDYTVADVPALAGAVGKTLQLVMLDDAPITSLTTWDDVTFSLDSGITVVGGEVVVAIFTQ